MAFAAIVTDAIERAGIRGSGQPGAVLARQAFEASLAPQRRGLIIGISHEGGTSATLAALSAAAARGAKVAAVTVSRAAPIGAPTALVLETAEIDRSWCHTIGYLSPILAGVAVGAALMGQSSDADPSVVRSLLAGGLAQAGQAEVIAAALAGCRELIVVASGADLPAGRELALKVEEAAWLPTTLRDTETFLHGHLPAMDASTGLVLVLVDRAAREARSARAQQALAAAAGSGCGLRRSSPRISTAPGRRSSPRPAGSSWRKHRHCPLRLPRSWGRPARSSSWPSALRGHEGRTRT